MQSLGKLKQKNVGPTLPKIMFNRILESSVQDHISALEANHKDWCERHGLENCETFVPPRSLKTTFKKNLSEFLRRKCKVLSI